ncbi:hypothetical protein HK101_003797 [Irineochytrium annulatum]|nr:hypothetical protein HK101_003797 [Irineochytrium annulatum]
MRPNPRWDHEGQTPPTIDDLRNKLTESMPAADGDDDDDDDDTSSLLEREMRQARERVLARMKAGTASVSATEPHREGSTGTVNSESTLVDGGDEADGEQESGHIDIDSNEQHCSFKGKKSFRYRRTTTCPPHRINFKTNVIRINFKYERHVHDLLSQPAHKSAPEARHSRK